MNDKLTALHALVDQQADDAGLWFEAATAPEAYCQQELRKLHEAVEATGISNPTTNEKPITTDVGTSNGE